MSLPDTFRAAMRRAGLDCHVPIIADGKFHRFESGEDRNANSWFILYPGPPVAGAFGCWKRQVKETFCERQPSDLNERQSRAVRESWNRAEKERQRAEKERHKHAQESAARILQESKPLKTHPYLASKGVQACGEARESDGRIVLPLRDVEGGLHTLQFIHPDGSKRFLVGGRVKGCFFTIADKTNGPLVLCEGYATGASIHAATGYAVICAMNCGNLMSVAEAIRKFWPTLDIIVAADNDQWTPGNPGLTKATAAAKAIRARLAVPQFRATKNKLTDFNDLAANENMIPVKKQIKAAKVRTEIEAETYARLAALSPAEYDRCRDQEADTLGIRVSTLDGEVEKSRRGVNGPASTLQGREVILPDVEPWPQPVKGAEVLNAIAATLGRYVVLPRGAADAMTLWVAHTHCFEAFSITPRLNISSPEKGCGKTTARDLVALFVSRPLPTENATAPVLFRLVEAQKPTLLADEYDSWLPEKQELRGILNSGHRKGGTVMRCGGDNHEVRAFEVFAPVVLCGIGHLPATLHDRSIVIRLVRAKPGELVARFDSRRVESESKLCRKLARWIADNRAAIEACDPKLPGGAFNRHADNWRPLFAIAEIAGGDWPCRAEAASAALTATNDIDAQGISTMLLGDIREVLSEHNAKRIFSHNLVAALNGMTDRPWREANRGKCITESWFAKRLRGFGIEPKTMRIGSGRLKGYETADFKDPFDRYLSN